MIDTIFGVKITDPYRNIENLNDSIVLRWLKTQNEIAEKAFNNINTKTDLLNEIITYDQTQLFNISRIRISENDIYFYIKKNKNESFNCIYMKDRNDGVEKLLFNSKDFILSQNEIYLINYYKLSHDASKIAIGLSKNDEEFSKIIIYDLNKNQILPDRLDHVWPNSLGGINWLPDNSSFLYTYVPIIDSKSIDYLMNTKLVLYKIGEYNKWTEILSQKKNPSLSLTVESIPIAKYPDAKSKYIFSEIDGSSIYREVYVTNVDSIKKPNWKLLFAKSDKVINFLNKGDDVYFITSKNASNYELCKKSLTETSKKDWEIVVEENEFEVISDFVITKSGVFYTKVKNGIEAKLYFNQRNIEREIKLPVTSGNIDITFKNVYSDEIWINLSGWTHKNLRYFYSIEKNEFIDENIIPKTNFDFMNDITVEEIEIKSYDGIMVPLSIIYNKNMKKNGDNPVFLIGYGAYQISLIPNLYDNLYHWVNKGGIFAVAHVRGGGEKGDNWYKGGFKSTKPNTWKDFIACTEYLIENKYTSPKKMVSYSGSAGGICVGRAMTERPDLYAACIVKVGEFNTLRSEFGASGKNNIKEFGTIKDSIDFRALLEMDSYYHIKKGTNYPAVYLTSGINDTRVSTWQPAKFAARLLDNTNSQKPILLSVDFESGHGFEADNDKKNEELNKIITFALWQTGHPDFQLKK